MLDTDLIVQEIGIAPGFIIVDAGCGTGYMARLFAEQVGVSGCVYALDVNEMYITELQENCSAENLDAFVCDMSDHLPVSSKSVDVVYVSTVLHSRNTSQLLDFVQETKRALRIGGILAVVEIAKHDTPFGPPLRQRYSPEELQTVVQMKAMKTIPVADHFYMQTFLNE